jgi:Holliday junction resolvase RusA-like endonuclease
MRLYIPGTPVPKGRAIPLIVGGQVRMVPHSPTRTYERKIGKAWTAAGGLPLEGPVSVRVIVTADGVDVEVVPMDGTRSALRGDVDNYAKSVLDGLNGVAWRDDSQVCSLHVTKPIT